MTQDIIEGNKLIGEFMGKQFKDPLNYMYDKEWNWIMPVFQKIEVLNVNIGKRKRYESAGTSIIIKFLPPYEIEMWNETGWSYKESGGDLLEQMYKASIRFIKWYNQNPQ